VKLVISEATFAAPEHGHARPEQKHTPAKASYASPFQAAVSHSAIWAAACLLCSPSCIRQLCVYHTNFSGSVWYPTHSFSVWESERANSMAPVMSMLTMTQTDIIAL